MPCYQLSVCVAASKGLCLPQALRGALVRWRGGTPQDITQERLLAGTITYLDVSGGCSRDMFAASVELCVRNAALVQAYMAWKTDCTLFFGLVFAAVMGVADFIMRAVKVDWRVRSAIELVSIVGSYVASYVAVSPP